MYYSWYRYFTDVHQQKRHESDVLSTLAEEKGFAGWQLQLAAECSDDDVQK